VRVYHFRVWDKIKGGTIVQPLKSDADRIKQLGGSIVPGTGEEVDEADLDADGWYDPKKSVK
jgi:hypothetical protein